jgi:hypothetical protein
LGSKAAFVLVGLAVTVGVANAAGTAKTYADPAGDSPFALDISRVTVADAKGGLITFTVRLRPAARRPGDQLFLYLDTDLNRSTGTSGLDYAVLFEGGPNTYTVASLAGANPVRVSAKSARSRCCAAGWVFSINRRELGNTKAFDFSVSTDFKVPGVRKDRAPNTGLFRYRLSNVS